MSVEFASADRAVQQGRPLELRVERLGQFRRRLLARQLPQQVARGGQLGQQAAVVGVLLEVLLDLHPPRRVEVALDVGTKLGLDVFGVLSHGIECRSAEMQKAE